MIVKDEELLLEEALRSVFEVVDEMVVVDTGSTDGTVTIAERWGARVLYHPWQDDFSAARNVSLRATTGDWILVLDADEQLDPAGRARLRSLLRRADEGSPLGYTVEVPDYYAEGGRYHLTVCRLFRNRPEIHFSGRVYESVLPSIRQLGGEVAASGIVLTHHSHRKPLADRLRKDFHYRRLRAGDNAAHPLTLFETQSSGTEVEPEAWRDAVTVGREQLTARIRERLLARELAQRIPGDEG